jgi:hypothetical protein
LWAATFESGDDAEDDEEVAVCNTLERGLNRAHRTFNELILPVTSVSFLLETYLFNSRVLPRSATDLCLVRGRPSHHQVRGEPAPHMSSARSGPNWRCSL